VRKKIYILLMIFILCIGAINIVLAVGSVPGSSDDPLITASFLDKKLQELSASLQDISSSVNQKLQQVSTNVSVLDSKVEEMNKKVGQSSGSTFEAVSLPAGKTLIGEAGTELILRSGEAKVLTAFQEYSERLACFFYMLCVLFSPEQIVISGGFSHSSELFLPKAQDRLAELLRTRREGQDLLPRIRVSQFRDEAGLLGAGFVALRAKVT